MCRIQTATPVQCSNVPTAADVIPLKQRLPARQLLLARSRLTGWLAHIRSTHTSQPTSPFANSLNMADDPGNPFSSPIKPAELPPKTPKTPTPGSGRSRDRGEAKKPFDAEEVREAALQRELEGVRNINEVIESVIGTLEKAKGNMGSVSQTVNNASSLLNTWTRILSQTEHNQRLILNKDWNGSSRDLEAIEEQKLAAQLAAQRKAEEDDRRRDLVRLRSEEQERARLAGTLAPTRGRGRGQGVTGSRRARGTRGRGLTRSGAAAANSSAVSSASRAGSQIGRGFGAGRSTRASRTTTTGRAVR
ncbi:DASH complex subunit Duo1-domain-containing protein [Coniella lustricola]|uniref:DASH complex subunit DUO1 n=1 Tax=Coniella lustricola TaxID=2025994 RepID=A0A2T3AGP8_9PEZI|nr:DASH complex subunit Duo1-domain-containing protein [Coniella lustricola]